jgi:molecular chaperone GrpE
MEEPSKESLLEDRLVRLQADFDNFRKRTLREREDLYRRANEDIISELLPVLDHLELAFQAAGDDGKDHSLVKGFVLVGEQLQKTLHKFGLIEVPTDDVEFDPNVHEAIQHLPSETIPENGIIARTRSGYMLGNRLLRAAQVVVSSGVPENETGV